MPLYEFICEECGQIFEELVSSFMTANDINCPYCHSDLVRKLISTFTSKVSGISTSLGGYQPGSSCSTKST